MRTINKKTRSPTLTSQILPSTSTGLRKGVLPLSRIRTAAAHAGPSPQLELSRVPTLLTPGSSFLSLSSNWLIVMLISTRVATVAIIDWQTTTLPLYRLVLCKKCTIPRLKVFILTLQVVMMPPPTASTRLPRPPTSKSNILMLLMKILKPWLRPPFLNSLLPSLLRPIINTYTPTLAESLMQLVATNQITTQINMTLTPSTMPSLLSAMAMMNPLAWSIGSSRTPGTPPGAIKGTSRSKWLILTIII